LASLGTFHQLWISKEEWQVSKNLEFFSMQCSRKLVSGTWKIDRGPALQVVTFFSYRVVVKGTENVIGNYLKTNRTVRLE
jgi:hypothetical protein